MNDLSKEIIIYSAITYLESFNKAVDSVARERKYLATVNGFTMDETKNFVNYVINNNYAQYFIIYENEVRGWCDIIPKSIPEFSHVGVLGIGILPEYRGRGLGKKLLAKTINHAKDINKLEKIELVVFESNINAIKLYKEFGFFEEGKRLKARKIDGKYDNELLMGKFL